MCGCPGAHPGSLGEHNAPLPEDGSVPNTAAHASSSSISPPAIGTECDASAGRCGAMRSGVERSDWAIAARDGPPQKARTSLPGCTCASSCGATHGTGARACWGRRATSAMAQRPWSVFLIATGPLRHPLPLGRHDAARSRSARGATARCWHVLGGDNWGQVPRSCERSFPGHDAQAEHVRVLPQGPLGPPAPRGSRVGPRGARAGQNGAPRAAQAVPGGGSSTRLAKV